MTDTCCSPSQHTTTSSTSVVSKVSCPTNQKVGKAVDTLTLKAMLAVPLTQVVYDRYYFCSDPNCPTVYYSFDGQQLFTESDLREKVYQKHPTGEDLLVCYCFQRTVASIRDEIIRTGASKVIEQITAGIEANQCACDIRNPQGVCCLGNVKQVVKRIEAELQGQVHNR